MYIFCYAVSMEMTPVFFLSVAAALIPLICTGSYPEFKLNAGLSVKH